MLQKKKKKKEEEEENKKQTKKPLLYRLSSHYLYKNIEFEYIPDVYQLLKGSDIE